MLTRLKINGFKNLVDVDVSLGPFTCVAGPNGAGKSNLFDAILFLAALADRPLMDAARCVRDARSRSSDARALFTRVGEEIVSPMSFEAEMLVPAEGVDDLGMTAKASMTFLRYGVTLGYRVDVGERPGERLQILREELRPISLGDASKHLSFPHHKGWRQDVAKGGGRRGLFISTEGAGDNAIIKLHQDGGQGRARRFKAPSLVRSVLSSTQADESPTALLARGEMRSWRLLQLEPAALREPDQEDAPPRIDVDGAHLPAALAFLERAWRRRLATDAHEPSVCDQLASRLTQLVETVRSVRVDEDKARRLLTLQVTDAAGNCFDARALSDGTLRFLALAVLELDSREGGVLCFEEPENGVHPARIGAMLRLLRDIAVDPTRSAGADNPLRQVLANTHSPGLVGLLGDDELLFARPVTRKVNGHPCRAATFACLNDTWRERAWPGAPTISRGEIAAYLNPVANEEEEAFDSGPRTPRRAVRDRQDLQLVFPFAEP